MINTIQRLFNWKKHPASVFYFSIPLFIIGMSLMGLRAYLEYKAHGDMVYTYIMLAGLALLIIALIPAYRMHKITQRFNSEIK